MSSSPRPAPIRLPAAILLFTGLCALYFLLYRGGPLSIDEISTFDSIESLTQHGTLSRTIEFYKEPTIAPDGSPFLIPLYEPLQIVAASPLYWLALRSEHIGQYHAVYLLNIIVTALTAVSLYGIAFSQGYSLRTACLAALVFGTATLALPYSRWLFREPLMALFALWTFAAAYDLRMRMIQRRPLLISTAILFASLSGMLLTKQTGLLFVPGVLLCLVPARGLLRRAIPLIGVVIAFLALFFVILLVANPDFGDDRYSLARWLNPANYGFDHMLESLLGYQISPGRSLWLYSPVMLLGFFGILPLLKRESKWLVFGVAVSLLVTSASYGALRLGTFWNGGFSWGPRYMLPLIPLWMLFLLPVLEKLPRFRLRFRLGVYVLVVTSFLLQIVGISTPFTYFYGQHYPVASGAQGWLAVNWAWQPSAIEYHLRNFSLSTFDSAWAFANPPVLVPLFLALVIGSTALFGIYLVGNRFLSRRAVIAIAAGMPLVLALVVVAGLLTLRRDARFVGDRQDVFELVHEMNTSAANQDIVFIAGSDYMAQFMNWFKAGALYITLPDDAAAAAPPSDQPITQEYLIGTIGPETANALAWAESRHDRVWLVLSPMSYSQDHPRLWQRYLSSRHYAVSEISISPFARAVLYATGRGLAFETRQLTPSPVFDQQIRLEAIETANLAAYEAGAPIPIGLIWSPLKSINTNLQLSLQLLNPAGELVAQYDTPLGQVGFGASYWETSKSYRQNGGLLLPRGLPPGDYTLQLVLYQLDSLQRLSIAAGDGDSLSDSYVLTSIRVD